MYAVSWVSFSEEDGGSEVFPDRASAERFARKKNGELRGYFISICREED